MDVLVNNAGLTRDGLLARMSDDDWRTVIETNLSSVFYTCRAVARPMMKKRAGAIVNISSIVGVHGNWGQTNYAASKAGIIGFTKSLARELGSRSVRANVVAPGYVRTQLTEVLPEEATKAMLDSDPARPARRSGGRRGRGPVLVLRRGLVRHGRSAARRRRPRHVACFPVTDSNGRRRIVVTGLGGVTSLGNTIEDTWAGLIAGRSGAGPITQFDSTGYFVHFACEVKDLEVTDYVDYKASRRMDRFTHLALAAARQAEADSGLAIAPIADRVGAAVATGIGGLKSFEACVDQLNERGPTASIRSRSCRSSRTSPPAGCRSSSARGGRCSPSARRVPPRTWPSATGWTRSGWAGPT